VFKAVGGGGGLLHQRGVLLGDLIKLLYRFAYLRNAAGLFLAGRSDLVDEVGDAADLLHDFANTFTCPRHEV